LSVLAIVQFKLSSISSLIIFPHSKFNILKNKLGLFSLVNTSIKMQNAFLAALGLASGVSASGPNTAMGEQLGNLLSQAISQDPAGANAAWRSANSNQQVVINPAVASLARGSSFLGSCTKLASCPQGWTSRGTFCDAPAGFYGCSKRTHRFAMTDAMKVKFAEQCDVQFECEDSKSFLQTQGASNPILNLHVAPSQSEGGDSVAAQAAALENLEAAGISFKQQVAQVLAGRSFLQNPIGDVQRIAENVGDLASEVPSLKAGLNSGDIFEVRNSLLRLLGLCSEPNAVNAMRLNMVGTSAANLMKRESTPHQVRVLAGSLITLMSNGPVASGTSDNNGANGSVNIVMPNPNRVY
jgi:CPW-WPC domain-containing protein